MAEILVKATSNFNGDPEREHLAYKSGDIVVVMPDGHSWGNKECLPDFYVFKIPGKTVDECKKYIDEDTTLDEKENPIMHVRRKYKFDYDAKIPKAELDAIKNSEWLVKSINELDIKLKPK